MAPPKLEPSSAVMSLSELDTEAWQAMEATGLLLAPTRADSPLRLQMRQSSSKGWY